MTELANKVIWITGASSGIGKALATTAAAQNTKLILSGRRVEALEALAQALPVDCLVPVSYTHLTLPTKRIV